MNKWRFCAVGNVVNTRKDEEGVLRHGTKEFCGGTRLYLYGRYWNETSPYIAAIGLDRHKKYRVVDLPVDVVKNVRKSKVYRHSVLKIMDNWEFCDVW